MESVLANVCLLLVGAVLLAHVSGESPVPVSAEPHHHLLLENPATRAYFVDVPPKGATLLHVHQSDYVTVWLGANSVGAVLPGEPERVSSPGDGDTSLVKAPVTHVVRNLAKASPLRNVTIEILPKQPQRGSVIEPYEGAPGTSTRLLFENEVVRAWDISIQPGATQPRHEHWLDYLAVAVTPLELRSTMDFHPPQDIRQKPGEVSWLKAPLSHSLTNMADQPARFISLEFK